MFTFSQLCEVPTRLSVELTGCLSVTEKVTRNVSMAGFAIHSPWGGPNWCSPSRLTLHVESDHKDKWKECRRPLRVGLVCVHINDYVICGSVCCVEAQL